MPEISTKFDLVSATLEMGTPERFELELYLPPIHIAGQDYRFHPEKVPAQLSVILLENGYMLAMHFNCSLAGACWRCLEQAELELDVEVEDFFEAELPPIEDIGEEEEPSFWYSEDGLLNLSAWAHDAVAEQLPPKILCTEECKGLCPQCGANLNLKQCGCEPPRDYRWEKLKDLQLDEPERKKGDPEESEEQA
jgi:uncharacterized protein